MSLKQASSSRYPHPHRMPAMTHWREEADEEDPFEDVTAHLWVERTVPQAVSDVEPPRPAVTNAAWVDWVEQRMREARAAADEAAVAEAAVAEAAVPEVDADPVVPELRDLRPPWAPPVAAPAQVLAWQRERESIERTAVRRHRIAMTGFISVAVALVAVLAAGTWWWVGQPDGEPPEQARSVAGGSRSTSGVPAPPVALPVDGEHTVIRIHDSGDLEVEQWIRPPRGITHLAMAAPDGVEVRDLSVARGSRQVDVPTSLLVPTDVSFLPGTTLYLHYWLSGALERSGTRALARVTSVTLMDDAPVGSHTIDFVGATVLSLACSATSGSDVPVPCGSEAGAKGWQVVSPAELGADVQVMAQIDIHPTG